MFERQGVSRTANPSLREGQSFLAEIEVLLSLGANWSRDFL
jgi:hypothetical protein